MRHFQQHQLCANEILMTLTAITPNRIDLRAASKAINRLLNDKEDTKAVFDIMRALSGQAIPKSYKRLLSSVEGGKLAIEALELQPILDDHDTMAKLPAGSVGRAYLDFVQGRKISAEGLAEESRKSGNEIDAAHPYAWYGRRMRDVHDLWHVLTGYETDALGEACVVSFSFAQTKSAGFALIGAAASNELQRLLPGHPVRRAAWQAYMNGRRAAWLPALDYVALLSEPLVDARKRLNIQAPTYYLAIPADERDGVSRNLKAIAA
jgi:ubiquinone biosynthesis protein COQ4